MLVLSFLIGAAVMHWWDTHRNPSATQPVLAGEETSSVWLLDMEKASTPQDMQEVKTAADTPQEVTIPSQLSKIELPGVQTVISRSGAEFSPQSGEEDQPEAGVVDLQNVSYKTIPEKEETAEETESKISMIEAPVSAKLISSVEEYREFKREARGDYPQADFNKQQVLVLESGSNLPDKAFEIVSVQEKDGKRLVLYRVNIFGLDKKTNTHSAQVLEKSKLALELKQVL